MGLIASYNLRSMIVRKGTAAMTAGGIAMVVAVFVMTLAIAQGFRATLVASGSPQNAIVLRKSATAETVSAVLRTDVPIVESLPQVARGPDGRPLASAELVTIIALPRYSDNQPANVPVRGVGPKAFDVRDTLTFVEGRRFTPGTREINAGKLAMGRFKGLTLGSDVKFGSTTWTVVGIFTADDASFESELWGDVDLMMPAFQRDGYQSLTVKLADPAMFDAFLQAFDRNRRERVCEREENHTLLQTLEMISGDTVNEKIRNSPLLTRLANSTMTSDRSAIEEIYLRAFSRKPDPEEMDAIQSLLTAGAVRRQEFEDVLWSALNSKEFIFNH